MIYLDNAATTALSESARNAMEPYFSTYYGNPSSIYRFGKVLRLFFAFLPGKSILPEEGRRVITGRFLPWCWKEH